MGGSELDLREITHHNASEESHLYTTVVYLMKKSGKTSASSSNDAAGGSGGGKGDRASGLSLSVTIQFESPRCSSAKFALSTGSYERSDGSGLLRYFKQPNTNCQEHGGQPAIQMDTASHVLVFRLFLSCIIMIFRLFPFPPHEFFQILNMVFFEYFWNYCSFFLQIRCKSL